jgi:hypothetical protein
MKALFLRAMLVLGAAGLLRAVAYFFGRRAAK